MKDLSELIEGSERLTRIFGRWPSFHDAEVVEWNLWRGDCEPSAGRYVLPVLTTKIHLWELTSQVDARGYLVLDHHTRVTLRFHGVDEVWMEGFNHQNAILGLGIEVEDREGGSPPFFRIRFDAAFGIASTFRCSAIEVLQAEPIPQPDRKG